MSRLLANRIDNISYGWNMAYTNGHSNSGSTVLVLYKVANSDSDRDDSCFNAFQLTRGRPPTLALVKEYVDSLL